MTNNDFDYDLPQLEEFVILSADTKRWKPSPDVEDEVLEALRGAMPTKLRPSDQQIELYYEKAHNLYKSGHYKEALSYFHILVLANAKHPKYHMALGACYHQLKEYEKAIDCYTISAMLDDQNPIPQYHMAACMVKLDQPFAALVALEMGYPRCDSSSRFKGLKDRMKMMKERLHKELEEKKAQGSIHGSTQGSASALKQPPVKPNIPPH